MRILVLTPTFLPALGGAELVILQVYHRLATRHSILVLTPYLSEKIINNSGSSEYNQLINFEVMHYRDQHTFMKIRGHKISCGFIPPFSLSTVTATRQAVKSFKPDVLNVHYVMPTGLAGLYAQKVLKTPTIITYNGRDVPGPGVPPLWKYWHRLIGLNCSNMTYVSKYCREAIYGNRFNQGHVIYNGVEESKAVSNSLMREIKSRFNLKNDESILFALQRLDSLKRIDVLIQSMPKILRYSPNTRLIIGGKGSELTRLKKTVADLNIADSVHFVGFIPQDELAAYFTMADLFVFHSTYETFGIVLAEAMNYRKAIVSVSNTAISEIVDDGENGLLVPTSDPDAFATAVLQLLNDKDLRCEMGKKGYEKTQKFFRWDAIASQYEKVFDISINN